MRNKTIMADVGGYLRAEDVPKIIAKTANRRDRLVIMTLAVTGRRVSEVVGPLGIRPVDLDAGSTGPRVVFTILKKRGDTPMRKWKYVPQELVAELVAYSANTPPTKPIFSMTRQYAFMIVRDAAARAGVTTVSGRPVHPHHFRHSWVVRRLESPNMDMEKLFDIQRYLEHSDISITQLYAHLNPKNEKKLFDI
jgi:integrase